MNLVTMTKKKHTKNLVLRGKLRTKKKKLMRQFTLLSVIALLLVGIDVYIFAANQKIDTGIAASEKPTVLPVKETNLDEKTAEDIANRNPYDASPKSGTDQTYPSDGVNRAGPLVVENKTTATYPSKPIPAFAPGFTGNVVNLRFLTGWTSGTTLSSLHDSSVLDPPNFVSISIDGYDANAVSVVTDFAGTPHNIIQITVKYLHMPTGPVMTVPAGSTTAQLHLTDDYGRTTTLALPINWE